MKDLAGFLPLLLAGAAVTIAVTFAASVVGLGLSFAGGLGRLSHNRAVRWAAGVYIEVFRGTSLLVQLFWLFFVLPFFGVKLSPFVVGVLTLGLNTGAYGSEIVRAGIQAVGQGQTDAATALNMTRFHRLTRIVLPQALVLMLPVFGNLLIVLLKATALLSLITLQDLTFNAQLLRSSTGRTVPIFSLVLVMYFLMAKAIGFGIRFADSRLGMRRADRELLSSRREVTSTTGALRAGAS